MTTTVTNELNKPMPSNTISKTQKHKTVKKHKYMYIISIILNKIS